MMQADVGVRGKETVVPSTQGYHEGKSETKKYLSLEHYAHVMQMTDSEETLQPQASPSPCAQKSCNYS